MQLRDKVSIFFLLIVFIIANGIFNNWTQELFGFPPSEEFSVQDPCSTQSPTEIIYAVRPDQTLAEIAAAFNTTEAYLSEINCLMHDQQLYPDQHLFVPIGDIPSEEIMAPDDVHRINMGPLGEYVCVVVPEDKPVNIFGYGDDPVAVLTGSVEFLREVNDLYIVRLPLAGVQGWVSTRETKLEGVNCP